MSTVGLIGLGAMGSGMAASLRRAGHAVHVFDVRREVAAPIPILDGLGFEVHRSATASTEWTGMA